MIDNGVDNEQRIQIVDHFTRQLKNSGYQRQQISEIVVSSLTGWLKKEERLKEAGKRFRSAEETLSERLKNKLLEVNSWYKDKVVVEDDDLHKEKDRFLWEDKPDSMPKALGSSVGNWRKGAEARKRRLEELKEVIEDGKGILETAKNKVQGVVFVQHTEYSRLAQNIREKLKLLKVLGSFKIKLVERTGDTLVDLLHKSNSWANEDCLRDDCLVCKLTQYGSKKGSCRKRNITYETFCITCERDKEKEKESLQNSDQIRSPKSDQIQSEVNSKSESIPEQIASFIDKFKKLSNNSEGIEDVDNDDKIEEEADEETESTHDKVVKENDDYEIEKTRKKRSREESKGATAKEESDHHKAKGKGKLEFKSKYIGESSCSAYERGKEHAAALRDLSEQSHMLKHTILSHGGVHL